jgi:hypothetical protein
MLTNLRRHIVRKHGKNEAVLAAMKADDKTKAFGDFRKQAIASINKERLKEPSGKVVLLCERKSQSVTSNNDLVQCSICNGCYSRKYFFLHRKSCQKQSADNPPIVACSIPLTSGSASGTTEFHQDVLPRFCDDEIGRLCKSDATVIAIGEQWYSKVYRKESKQSDVRKSTMQNMRRLSSLFLQFQQAATLENEVVDVEAMFNRRYFRYIEKGIQSTFIFYFQKIKLKYMLSK